MIDSSEFFALIFCVAAVVFVLGNLRQLKVLPDNKLILSGLIVFLVSTLATVLEGIFWADFLNYLEHVFYIISSGLVCLWCWKTFISPGKKS
ncbi:MAG: hypothetical protein ABII88_11675 [Candidatus Omnitrophota bacterium]